MTPLKNGCGLAGLQFSLWVLAAFGLAAFDRGSSFALDWHSAAGHRWASLPVSSSGQTGFTQLEPSQTGIAFTNWLSEERYLTNQILLNGSGLALGDVDGDGWCDLFFAGIEQPCAFYRNLGQNRFQDATIEAGIVCAGQSSSGAALADVDGDSDLDLLINGVGIGTRLFHNDGHGHFIEMTARSGLRGGTGSMSLALADIDGNGTLDLYVANYRTTTLRDQLQARFKAAVTNGHYEILAVDGRSVTEPDLMGRYQVDTIMGILENGEADVLYCNDGHGHFESMSWTNGAFLDEDGNAIGVPYDWGLSVMFRDLNKDGAPDLYVCNDFHSPDRIWINDGRGRFRAISRLAIRQTSIFSMGIDFADVDRDGHDDFFVADMLSRKHSSRHVQLMDRRPMPLPLGVINNRPQHSRNTLFWNRGDMTFAEIAQGCGIEASEWTWCPTFLDVDLDGFEDLLMVTGHVRDAQNIDISRQIEAMTKGRNMPLLEQLRLRRLFTKLDVPNFLFRNRGNLAFEECGAQWGFDSHRVCQGIGFADLDNDGDLDVVVNCLNDGPLILRNNSTRPRIAIRLLGLPPNTRGIGSEIRVSQADFPFQSQEMICGGHYLSSDEAIRVFGAADASRDLTIEVRWRSGRRSVINSAKSNRIYEVIEAEAKTASVQPPPTPAPLFVDASHQLRHRHFETVAHDYQRQPLLPFLLSQLGPGVSWFDLDGNGAEDLIVPSGKGGRLTVFTNDGKGMLGPWTSPLFESAVNCDQTTAIGYHIQTAGAMIAIGSANYEDNLANSSCAHLFSLTKSSLWQNLPEQESSTGPMAMADADGDGYLELFVGGRVRRGCFPALCDSRLWRYRLGKYEVDVRANPALNRVGMVSAAIWSNLDGQGAPELILACHCGPIRVFHFEQGRFVEITGALGLSAYIGLWNSVAAADFDNDGRLDLAAGNWGRNSKYQSFLPLHLYYGDLFADGSYEVIEAYHDKELDKIVPWRDWETLASAMPFIKGRYSSFTAFSTAGVKDFLDDYWPQINHLEINTLESLVFLNRGDHFEAHTLPREAQDAPVFGLAAGDLDGDGSEDLFLSQNFFGVPPPASRLDAGRSVFLKGNGAGQFAAIQGQNSGLFVYGEGRGAALCDFDHDGRLDLAVAQNAQQTMLFRNQRAAAGLRIRLIGPPGNPQGIGSILRLQYCSGRLGPAREVHAGGGYWSQDAATQVMGVAEEAKSILVQWPNGSTTRSPVQPGELELTITGPSPQ